MTKNMAQELQFTEVNHPNPTPSADIATIINNPNEFGVVFSDHMVTVQWTKAQGWHDAKVTARKPFMIDPACAVLHYAQEVFEGLKAYKTEDGRIVLFRPDQNARRFVKSAERMAMAPVPEKLFLQATETLIKVDKEWVPGGEGSLYLRLFMFATDVALGVKPSNTYTFCGIASPVVSYFKGGRSTITVWVTTTDTRAAKGGTGSVKCGGNYANGLRAQSEAYRHECDQVVFLDAIEHRWVEELGGMNVFFIMADGRLVTPPLGDTILDGIIRNSVITLAKELDMIVDEHQYAFDQWRSDARTGVLKEVFACGTAAVISAIGKVRHTGGEFEIGNGGEGPVTQRLREILTGIQHGKINDTHGWVHQVI